MMDLMMKTLDFTGVGGHAPWQVRLINDEFLLKNDDFLLKNDDLLLKNVDFIMK